MNGCEEEISYAQSIIALFFHSSNSLVTKNFMQPIDVNTANCQDYYKNTAEPICLTEIKSKLDDNVYTDIREFICDIRLMFFNCYRYFGCDSKMGKLCAKLEGIFEQKLILLPNHIRLKTSMESILMDEDKEMNLTRRRCADRSISTDVRLAMPIKSMLDEIEKCGTVPNLFIDSSELNGDPTNFVMRQLQKWEEKRKRVQIIRNFDSWFLNNTADKDRFVLYRCYEFVELVQIIHLTYYAVGLDKLLNENDEVVFEDVEYALYFPRSSRILAAIVALSTTISKNRVLTIKSGCPNYEAWNDMLSNKLRLVYRTWTMINHDETEMIRKWNLDSRTFKILGNSRNPMEKLKFHELSIWQRCTILVAMFLITLKQQDTIRSGMDRSVDWDEERMEYLGRLDSFDYVRFPCMGGLAAFYVFKMKHLEMDPDLGKYSVEVEVPKGKERKRKAANPKNALSRKPTWFVAEKKNQRKKPTKQTKAKKSVVKEDDKKTSTKEKKVDDSNVNNTWRRYKLRSKSNVGESCSEADMNVGDKGDNVESSQMIENSDKTSIDGSKENVVGSNEVEENIDLDGNLKLETVEKPDQKEEPKQDPDSNGSKDEGKKDPDSNGSKEEEKKDPDSNGSKEEEKKDPDSNGLKEEGEKDPDSNGSKEEGKNDPDSNGSKEKEKQDPDSNGSKEDEKQDSKYEKESVQVVKCKNEVINKVDQDSKCTSDQEDDDKSQNPSTLSQNYLEADEEEENCDDIKSSDSDVEPPELTEPEDGELELVARDLQSITQLEESLKGHGELLAAVVVLRKKWEELETDRIEIVSKARLNLRQEVDEEHARETERQRELLKSRLEEMAPDQSPEPPVLEREESDEHVAVEDDLEEQQTVEDDEEENESVTKEQEEKTIEEERKSRRRCRVDVGFYEEKDSEEENTKTGRSRRNLKRVRYDELDDSDEESVVLRRMSYGATRSERYARRSTDVTSTSNRGERLMRTCVKNRASFQQEDSDEEDEDVRTVAMRIGYGASKRKRHILSGPSKKIMRVVNYQGDEEIDENNGSDSKEAPKKKLEFKVSSSFQPIQRTPSKRPKQRVFKCNDTYFTANFEPVIVLPNGNLELIDKNTIPESKFEMARKMISQYFERESAASSNSGKVTIPTEQTRTPRSLPEDGGCSGAGSIDRKRTSPISEDGEGSGAGSTERKRTSPLSENGESSGAGSTERNRTCPLSEDGEGFGAGSTERNKTTSPLPEDCGGSGTGSTEINRTNSPLPEDDKDSTTSMKQTNCNCSQLNNKDSGTGTQNLSNSNSTYATISKSKCNLHSCSTNPPDNSHRNCSPQTDPGNCSSNKEGVNDSSLNPNNSSPNNHCKCSSKNCSEPCKLFIKNHFSSQDLSNNHSSDVCLTNSSHNHSTDSANSTSTVPTNRSSLQSTNNNPSKDQDEHLLSSYPKTCS